MDGVSQWGERSRAGVWMLGQPVWLSDFFLSHSPLLSFSHPSTALFSVKKCFEKTKMNHLNSIAMYDDIV